MTSCRLRDEIARAVLYSTTAIVTFLWVLRHIEARNRTG